MARFGAELLVLVVPLCTGSIGGCDNAVRSAAPARSEPTATASSAPASVTRRSASAMGTPVAPVSSARDAGHEDSLASEPAVIGWPPLVEPDDRDFCSSRVHMLDADACFVLPERRTDTLLIYLHGIVPPTRESTQKNNLEAVVAKASQRAGVVALLPRGEQGFAPRQYPGWWGWPTSKATYAREGARFIEKIEAKRRALEAALKQAFTRVYLAGSSSGAYFVAAVALHGGMPEVDGFGLLSGGAGYATEQLANLPKKPVYVGFGSHDSVAGSARALGQRLEQLGWPVKIAPHPVPHGAREIYLDEAFAFWHRHQD